MKYVAILCLVLPLFSLTQAQESSSVLEFRLQEDAQDVSGKNLHGTVHGNPRFETVDGRTGLVLDGAGDWVEANAKLPETGQAFTIECWVRPAADQVANADIFGNHTHAGQGLVLQQDAANTNSFAFNYGDGAGGWIHTRPIQLAAERWQHVAIVKSAKELRFYLNGLLLDTTPATAPIVASPLTFRVGLGFADESRCFKGAVSELRIWDRALSEINPKVSVAQQVESLANNTSVRLSTATSSRIFTKGSSPVVELSWGDNAMTAGDSTINAAFECEDLGGKKISIAPVGLTRQGGFKHSLPLLLQPGYYRLTCKPTLTHAGGVHGLKPSEISFAVLGDDEAPRDAREPQSVTLGSQPTQMFALDGEGWLLATDPANIGRAEQWFQASVESAKPTRVPWIIQDVFPDYHGVAWYWRDFDTPLQSHADGRFILRFWAVDYFAEVWVNGVKVGEHEGSEDPFELDVTAAIKPGVKNRLAVRVLNPTREPIDGIALGETAHGPRSYPVGPGSTYNVGGIVDSVELLATPAVRVENLYVRPDWKTGRVQIEANLRNASNQALATEMRFTIGPANAGGALHAAVVKQELKPGDTLVRTSLSVAQHRLWSLEDPFLYRVTVQAGVSGSASFDEKSTRFGFRDFRYENDAFRLNGKRLFLQGALLLPHYPVGFRVPPREDFLRRDVLAAKAMGLNTIRVIWGGLRARDLDVFDELGMLVQQEHYGAIQIAPSTALSRRFDASLSGVMRRDRNHPSIVIWCLLNEMWDGPQFRHAVQSLPLVKHLDDTRLVWLGSGGFDMQFSQGSLSNPGAMEWQHLMGSETPGGPGLSYSADYGRMLTNQAPVKADIHPYQPVPHTAAEIERMRNFGVQAKDRKIMVTEIGTGCAVNLPRYARHYEQMGATHADDARYYRDKHDHFMADWKQWNLGCIWSQPEDFFLNSERNMLKLRRETGNALRANPHLAGYYFCALTDSDFDGIGLLNSFREIKPGAIELQQDLTAPVRWCLFAEPANVYSGASVKLEALLSDLDALPAGDYPVTVEVVASDGHRVFAEKLSLTIPDPSPSAETPLVRSVFAKDIPITGPTGPYQFLVRFDHGAAATGGEIEFQVFHAADMPPVKSEVVLWGKDESLAAWLARQKIRTRPFASPAPDHRELILVGNGGGDVTAFRELASRMASGSTVIFLSPTVFARGTNSLGFLPLATKGTSASTDFAGGYYRGDTFAPRHPVFAGLPSGGILDYTLYRNIITQGGNGVTGLPVPDDLIVAGIRAQFSYASVMQTAAYRFGTGRFIFNTLRITENLGTDPVAERLLRNLINYAAPDLAKPPVALPADFDQQLKAIGYE